MVQTNKGIKKEDRKNEFFQSRLLWGKCSNFSGLQVLASAFCGSFERLLATVQRKKEKHTTNLCTHWQPYDTFYNGVEIFVF